MIKYQIFLIIYYLNHGGYTMEQVRYQGVMQTIAGCVKDHIINNLDQRLSILSTEIGVSHPTSSKILNPEKENAGGVAIKHWLATLSYCNLLDKFLSELERQARDWHRPAPVHDSNCPEEGMQRIVHLTQSFHINNGLNVNNIGCLIGVSFTTARAMTTHCESSSGVAIKSWLTLFDKMKILNGLTETFQQLGTGSKQIEQGMTHRVQKASFSFDHR